MKTRSGKSHYRDVIIFEKPRFQNVFRPHENEKPTLSTSTALKSDTVLFLKTAPFSRRISVDDKPNRRNKATVFSNFSGVMWKA